MQSALVFHGSADLYGSDQTTIDMVRGLLTGGWRVTVALPHEGPLVAVLEQAGATVHIGGFAPFGRSTLSPLGLLTSPYQVISSTLACWRLVRNLQPDVVHANTLIIPAPALAGRLAGKPVVWHIHEIMTRPKALVWLLTHLVGLLASKVACNSEATLDVLASYNPRLRKKATVVPNGVTDFPVIDPDQVRAQLGIPPNRFVFLFVGRLNAWKGQEVFVEAAAAIARRHPSAYFLAAGDAPDGQPHFRESFEALIEKHEMEQSFRYLGFRSDTHALYSAADASVVPSLLPEPFGLVAAEAMAASLPVIVAGHGGLKEIVVDGETGVHIEPGSVPSLIAAMETMLASSDETLAMGEAGKQRQREYFSVGRYQRSFLEMFQDLAGKAA